MSVDVHKSTTFTHPRTLTTSTLEPETGSVYTSPSATDSDLIMA